MTQMKHLPTILIVGASRGIGFGLVQEYLARGWRVIATERTQTTVSPLQKLAAQSGGTLTVELLDINVEGQIEALAARLNGTALDVLFVNAGVSDDPKQTIGEITTQEFTRVMITNALSPMRVIEKFAPLVKANGCVAAMSTALASISQNKDGGYETYRASKVALNMLLRSYVARAGDERTVLALMPGWVRTEMGGPDAPVEVADSVRGLADTVDHFSGQQGLVFVDYQKQVIPW